MHTLSGLGMCLFKHVVSAGMRDTPGKDDAPGDLRCCKTMQRRREGE